MIRRIPFVLLSLLMVLISSASLFSTSEAAQDRWGNEVPSNMLPYEFINPDPFAFSIQFSSLPGNNPGEYVLQNVYPVCNGAKDFDCIVSVDWIDSNGVSRPGKFEEYIPVGYRGIWCQDSDRLDPKSCDPERKTQHFPWTKRILTKGDENRLIPDGSRSSIWTFPGLEHEKGNRYLVQASSVAEMTNQKSPFAKDSVACWNCGSSQFQITPVGVSSDTSGLAVKQISYQYKKEGEEINFLERYGSISNQEKRCYLGEIKETPICISRSKDTISPRFRMSIRLKLTRDFLNNRHWLVGRASDVKIFTDRQEEFTTITLEGTTIKLPSAVALVPRTAEGYKLTRIATNKSYADSGARNEPVDINDLSGFEGWSNVGSSTMSGSDPGSIGFWESIESAVDIRTGGVDSTWFFETANTSTTDVGWLWPCVKTPQLSGVIASNATVMRPTPPKWNAATETLEFRIASPHLDEKGKIAEGFYNLSVSREVATCLWGKDVVNARASVTVVNQDGEKKIFTSSYVVSSGYLNFQIAGFTYSVNTIKIRLEKSTEAPSPTPQSSESTPKASKIESQPQKKSITCVKGKTIKKVTTKTCPAGFKKRV